MQWCMLHTVSMGLHKLTKQGSKTLHARNTTRRLHHCDVQLSQVCELAQAVCGLHFVHGTYGAPHPLLVLSSLSLLHMTEQRRCHGRSKAKLSPTADRVLVQHHMHSSHFECSSTTTKARTGSHPLLTKYLSTVLSSSLCTVTTPGRSWATVGTCPGIAPKSPVTAGSSTRSTWRERQRTM